MVLCFDFNNFTHMHWWVKIFPIQCDVGGRESGFHNSIYKINQNLNIDAYLYTYIQAHFLFFIQSYLINSPIVGYVSYL